MHVWSARSEVSMSGKAAAFGGRMMNTVADQMLKQFADNFAAQVGALAGATAAPAAATAAAPPRPPRAVRAAAPPRRLNGLALAVGGLRELAARPVRQEDGMSLPGSAWTRSPPCSSELEDAGYVAEPRSRPRCC